jgi:thermitase
MTETRRLPGAAGLLPAAACLLLLAGAFMPRAGADLPGRGDLLAQAPELVTGELLVQYGEGVTSPQARAFERGVGITSSGTAGPGRRLARVQLPAGANATAWAAQLRATPGVASVQPDFIYRATRIPADPAYVDNQLWGLKKIGCPQAWDSCTGSAGVVVAVIDTGIDYGHPDLAANCWTNVAELNGKPGVDDDGNGYIDDVHGFNFAGNNGNALDDCGHGTHVAGTIGAVADTAGVVGVNWQVSLMACKFLDAGGSGTTFDAIRAIDYVNEMRDQGVNIVAINASWGGSGYDQALRDAIGRANSRGILFICAAGNGDAQGRAIDNDRSAQRNYPSSFDDPNIIAVTATDSADARGSWANYGANSVDLAAPGIGILSTIPGGYASYSGTSMATPHVTGTAALLKAFSPGLGAAQIKDLILRSVDPVPGLQGRCVTGGRLNAGRALAMAPAPAPGAPSAPTGLAAGRVTANQVQLSWNDVATNESGYRVFRSDTGGAPAALASLGPGSNSYTDLTVVGGRSYSYFVEAFNNAGTGDSGAVTVDTPAAPAAPSGLQARAVSAIEVDLSWTPNSTDEDGFAIYRSATGGAGFAKIGTTASGARSYRDATASGGATYSYYVEAYNANGAAASGAVSVTTPPDDAKSMRVAGLTISLQKRNAGGRVQYRAVAQVKITNGKGAPIPGARLSGSFTGATLAYVAGSTIASGTATFGCLWQAQSRGAVYTFTVTGAQKDGYTYRPAQNALTSASATVR